jgi:hypothetical protein
METSFLRSRSHFVDFTQSVPVLRSFVPFRFVVYKSVYCYALMHPTTTILGSRYGTGCSRFHIVLISRSRCCPQSFVPQRFVVYRASLVMFSYTIPNILPSFFKHTAPVFLAFDTGKTRSHTPCRFFFVVVFLFTPPLVFHPFLPLICFNYFKS